jgi:hypothetical protein
VQAAQRDNNSIDEYPDVRRFIFDRQLIEYQIQILIEIGVIVEDLCLECLDHRELQHHLH